MSRHTLFVFPVGTALPTDVADLPEGSPFVLKGDGLATLYTLTGGVWAQAKGRRVILIGAANAHGLAVVVVALALRASVSGIAHGLGATVAGASARFGVSAGATGAAGIAADLTVV